MAMATDLCLIKKIPIFFVSINFRANMTEVEGKDIIYV